ncbi:MAG: UDP-N-acetylmuramoyl-L-alanine--D-glutamate ligase [Candidatus Carbobacillus sp.]|nr:UDP-N-acetylmuramoyl-L-alanine--D-glutamate ligase [Candidatus Carbobacillus sp.]
MAFWQRGREAFQNRRIFVLGAGKSGTAVARLLVRLGAHVTISDEKAADDAWSKAMRDLGIDVRLGQNDPDELIALGIELMIKNPGIPYRHPYVQRARSHHIPVWTEVEVAYRLWEGTVIAVTGSNGKTTTSYLLHAMLELAGISSLLAGNIGTPLADVVEKTHQDLVSVLELSSFQLKGTESFRPDVGVWLNLYPHHLDYHETMEDYTDAKARLFQHMREDDTAVFNADQPFFRQFARTLRTRLIWFSIEEPAWRKISGSGGEERESWLFTTFLEGAYWAVYASADGTYPLFPLHELSLPGTHNVYNALAAAAGVLALDKGDPSLRATLLNGIRQAVRTFSGVPYRLEKVLEKNGIAYYNDAKATNPEATASALASFSQPVVWIAGGLERGESFDPLLPYLSSPVVHAVFYGQTKERFRDWVKAHQNLPVDMAEGLEMAITLADRAAQKIRQSRGERVVVLYSPACASWDMFPSYEVRGDIFTRFVHTL